MNRPLRVLVVDDEPLARAGLIALVERDPELEVVGQCGDGRSAVEAIRTLSPDLVLLDIQMPELDGFEVIATIGPERMPAVIFTTAYDQFAVRAFEVNALDYLLKPFQDERFAEAIGRSKARLRDDTIDRLSRQLLGLLADEPAPAAERDKGAGYLGRIAVKQAGRVAFIRTDDIDWIEAADYYVRLHVGRKQHLLRETMNVLETSLDPAKFFRAHRSAIINLDRLVEIQPWFHGDHVLLLGDGTKVKLSRGRKEALEAALRQKL